MQIEDLSTEEIEQELAARKLHSQRQSEVYRGEREDFTDGDQHIEDNGGVFRGVAIARYGRGEY